MNGRGAAPTVSALGPAETARAVRTAVVDGDVDALHSELCRIRNDLVDHPHDGDATPAPEHAPEAVLRLVRHGRQHLLHLVGELFLTTSAAGRTAPAWRGPVSRAPSWRDRPGWRPASSATRTV